MTLPPPFLHPDISIPGRQNQYTQPLSRDQPELVRGEFLHIQKAKNDGLRKQSNNLRQGINNICQEMRSTFLARPPTQTSLPWKHNNIESINSSLPPRSTSTSTSNLSFPSHHIPILNSIFYSSSNSTKVKSYNRAITSISDMQWTEVKLTKNKSGKIKNTENFPAPLKAPRPEQE